MRNDKIVKAAQNNPLSAFIDYFNKQLVELFLELLDKNQENCTKVLSNEAIKKKVGTRLAKHVYEQARKGA